MAQGVFSSDKILDGNPMYIDMLARKVAEDFAGDGFETKNVLLLDNGGGSEVEVSKGGMFQAILGLRYALKVTLKPEDGKIHISAGVGVFGRQALPAVLAFVFFRPLFITQIWGMIQQAKLDERAIAVAERELERIKLQDEKPIIETQAIRQEEQ